MIKNVVETIGGVGNYGVIAVCLFFLSFSGALAWAFLMKKTFLKSMSRLPLDEESGEIQPAERRPRP